MLEPVEVLSIPGYFEIPGFNRYAVSPEGKVVNTKTGKASIYLSALDCSKAMGIKPTALNYRLKSKGSKVFSDGCTYCYYCESI